MTSDETRTFAESLATVDGRAKSEIFIPADQNPSQFTFYREGTPPPAGRIRQKETGSSTTGPGSAGAGGVGAGLTDEETEGGSNGEWDSDGGRICGIRKLLFWSIVAGIVLFIVAMAVGLGVGLGLAKQKSTSTSPDGVSATGTTEETPSPTVELEPTGSTPTSSSSPTSAAALSECPDADGKTYPVPGTDKDFLIACGIDYASSRGEAVDLGQVLAESMADCMKSCAHFPGCQACGWGFIEGDEGDALRCWLKGNLAQYHTARANWSFAILQPNE